MPDRPNFLVIMTDQQRWDTLGLAKPAELRTPTFDALVADGCLFTHAFCQGPICVPSRASFLTGKYVHQHRLFHNNGCLPDCETTWADVLAQAGYATVAVGRTHTIHKGFEHVYVPIGNSYLDFTERLYESDWQEFLYGHEAPVPHPDDREQFVEFRRTQAACDTLRDLAGQGAPFAMFLGYCAPHNPYVVPEPYVSMYDDVDFPPPRVPELDPSLPDYNEGQTRFLEKMQAAGPSQCARYYYGMVSMIDECVGRVLGRLDELGLRDNTIVVFTSDHGEMLGDHGRWAKGNIYEQSIRIPLLVVNPPRVPPGTTCDALVESVDLFPTILDYAGVTMANQAYRLRGRSLRELIEGTATRIRSAVFAQLPPWIMVRTKRWKLGYGYPKGDCYTDVPAQYRGVLYDLANDPDERHNLFDDPAHGEVRGEMLRRLVDFHLDVKIPLHKDVGEIAFENMPTMPMCLM